MDRGAVGYSFLFLQIFACFIWVNLGNTGGFWATCLAGYVMGYGINFFFENS